MVNKVVATKLTEDEHSKLLDACNTEGCSPSSLIRDAILKRIETEPEKKDIGKMSIAELEKAMRETRS